MITTEKTCFKCNKTLPLEAFYKHKAMADGLVAKKIKTTEGTTGFILLEEFQRQLLSGRILLE